ncbi:glycosyltransferase family 4 protein [Candidatus Binatia bacterium]|nr:glycosyltransferase family 4 protein [Candidatus Binatia bacterium]
MRIGIGAILGTLGGPATYARALVTALAAIDSDHEYVVITDAPDTLGVQAPNVRCAVARLPTPFLQPVWDHLFVPIAVRRHRLDLYHGTKGILPVWTGCPAVVTVHDLAVYRQPETFAWLQRIHLRSHTPLAVRRAARVIADSESAKRDIRERFSVPDERVTVIPLAAAPIFGPAPCADDARIAAAMDLPARYVLYAGTIQPRKHVELLVDAFGGVAHGDTALLIAGRARPGYQPAFLTRPPPGVRYLGPVGDAELAVLYRRADALFSLSGYEGFGLSLLEAMTSGCLVVAGRNSAVPEVVGDGGILLSEFTLPAVREALGRVLAGDPSLAVLRARGLERSRQYSWEATARRTLAVYEAAQPNR